MKKLFCFISALLIIGLQAQSLKDFSVPKGYQKIAEAKGDLDKDGKDETVIIFNTDKKNKLNDRDNFLRSFFILKNIDGKLKIWKENSTLLLSSGMGFYPEENAPPEISINNNSLSITQIFNTNSRHTQTYQHTFRFQNGDFYLIGSHDRFEDTCDFNYLNEINFSTGKVIADEEYSSCDEEQKVIPKDTHKEFKHPFKTLIKMNSFKIGEHKFKIPGSDKDFIY
ncbi:hypothetical protein EG346_08585 [Chryseobacterium carnipullorum]|uniref:VCBS repeat-containing protein n=1 Tax=Chryseobacterium carnipullorum TaxID=1124835 RepID=A0A376DNI4_CHRCU|nr:hypothetical protein [Chryseobacterium carnipullorum]MDN5394995.1 hypothetical protein [Chryseobacterium sp.]AZA48234.1 hypothetical protein EG346_08585 [Chryseobacterium carnipullorum]AZA67537.1 hypothetical protein EG345_24800 [Chryseobacterium carnipullorum]MDN5475886.1 hypothetical protein [Chryseobacterium sp.]STC91490.1 Uncharacterised protein [Chryseobacterium carnipullorum]